MNTISLNKLPMNSTATVEYINCNNEFRQRMLDLGIIKGSKIIPVLKSPSGDPIAYEIRGSIIAIRKEDANLISVV